MHVIGVFNRDGGTFKTMDMKAFAHKAAEVFGAAGHQLEPRIVDGRTLMAELKRAAAEADLLLAGGGDGTISAAASVAFAQKIPLAVLPAGTMNLFARSIGIPLGLEAALAALASGDVDDVDIATANGRPFVHQFSVGIHPKLVKLREQLAYKSRVGKMLASTRAAFGAVLRPPKFTIEVVGPFGSELRRVAGLSITNNPLDEGHLPLADRLDRGVLGIYLMKPLTLGVMLRLAWGILRGKFKSLPEVIDREAGQSTMRFPAKRPSAMAVIDGELIKLEREIAFVLHPRGLKVVVPKAPAGQKATPKLLATA
jgi:diacylglycerol kinase family enzyme